MGPSPHPAPPTDSNMPPSQPIAHPLAIYTAQNPVIPAVPAVLGPSFYPHSVVSTATSGSQERSIRTADQLTLQHPAQPSRTSNPQHGDTLHPPPCLRVPDSLHNTPAGAVSDHSAQRGISPAHAPVSRINSRSAAGVHGMGHGAASQRVPTPHQAPMAGGRTTTSHPAEGTSHAIPPHSACEPDATGVSSATRSLAYSTTADVAQMPTQPGQQSAGSMATAVMHALMGSAKQSFQGQAHAFHIGNVPNPVMAVNHASDDRQDAAGTVSIHRIPAAAQGLPGGGVHRSLPRPHPPVPAEVSLIPGQLGAIQSAIDPAADLRHNGHSIAAHGPVEIRASQVAQGGGSAGDFEPYTVQLPGPLSSIDGVRYNPAVPQPVATMCTTPEAIAPTPRHAPHPILHALAATVQARTVDIAQRGSSTTCPGSEQPQSAPTAWQEPLSSSTVARALTKQQSDSSSDQTKRRPGRQPGLAAGRKRNPLHTRPLSKPLPDTQADISVPSLPESHSSEPSDLPASMPPVELPLQNPHTMRPPEHALVRSLPQSTRTPVPHVASPSTDGYGAVHLHPVTSSAVQPLVGLGQAINVLAPPTTSTASMYKPPRAALNSVRHPSSTSPRVNAPQPLAAPSRHMPPAALPHQPATQPIIPGPGIKPAIANPMQRAATTQAEVAVLAGASQPSEVLSKNAAADGRPQTQNRAGASSAVAKSVRPALSFGGANRPTGAASRATQPAPRVRSSGRPSILTRKLLSAAEPHQNAAATAPKVVVSNVPSSSRTESEPRDESDAALDTALSSCTEELSPRTPPPQSSGIKEQITVKHLLDTGLLKAGPQVLKLPLNGCMHAAGVRCDGTLEYRGNTVCTLAGLFDGDACKAVSEENAWRLVRHGRWNLRHYRRLYCLSAGALCPPGTLDDALQIIASDYSGTASPQSDDDQTALAMVSAGEDVTPQLESVGMVSAMLSMGGSAVPGQVVSGMKRTRRQAAVLQASEAEELSEALMKPAKLPASLPFNCLFERGIVRFGAQPAVAAAPAPSAQTVLIKPAAPSAPAVPKPPGARPVGRPPSKLGKPAAKPATKAAVKPAAKPVVKPALATDSGPISAMAMLESETAEAKPLLQAIDKMQRLPPMPRKVKTLAATMPRAPTAAPSSTAICPVDSQQRSRRDVRAPPRHSGIYGLDHTMMQLEAYSKPAGEKGIDAQPFAVDVHPAVVAAMDIHAHMCQNEVIGVLGGTYESDAGRLQVLRAVSVQEGPLDVGHTDVEMDAADQSRAIEELRQDGLQCIGWYHSHPTFAVWPSAIDVYNQNIQQVARSHETAAGNPTPYIAAIVGPYDQKNATAQSCMSWFYVENKRSSEFSLDMDPELCLQHMVPKLLVTNLVADAQLDSSELMDCAARLIQKYASYESRIEFREFWRPELTNLQKLVSSLFHSVRAYLGPDELKEVGNRIVSEVMQHFYGVLPAAASRGGNGRQSSGGKPARSTKKA